MPFQKGNPGRPKGAKNKATQALREMILDALDEEGGVQYLRTLAIEQPAAFASLLGKVLPTQLTGENGGPVRHEFAWHDDTADALTSPMLDYADASGETAH